MASYQKLVDAFRDLGTEILFISADPPDVTRWLRRKLGITFRLIADERHVTADHYGIPISYRSPRQAVYADGYIQPAAFAYHGDREILGWIHRPAFWNFDGATFRASPRRVLRRVRSS